MTSSASALPNKVADTAPDSVSIAHLYREMWRYAGASRWWLVLSSSMLVASQLCKLAVPWFAAQAINAIQADVTSAGMLKGLGWVGAIMGTCAACWVLHGPGRVIERIVAIGVRRTLTDTLYARLSAAPLAWHETHHSAELAHRVSQATHALANFTQSQFIYLQNTVNLIGPMIALLLLSWTTGALSVGGLLAIGLTIVAFDRVLTRLAVQENEGERRYAALLHDCLSNVSSVLSLRLQRSTRRLLSNRLDGVVNPLRRNITITEWKWCAVDLLTVLLTWSLVLAYAWGTSAKGALMLGGVFMVYQYAQQAGSVIGSLAANLQNFTRIRTDFASAEPIWQAPDRHHSAAALEVVPTPAVALVHPLPSEFGTLAMGSAAWHHIDLCGLNYRHRDGDDGRGTGLHHICLRLNAGERVALVGPSGGGKSTLLRLLAGLYSPSAGHIEVDGVAPLGMRDLSPWSTLLPQEVQVFEGTVRENMAFGAPRTDGDLHRAAHTSSFDSVLAGLPQGLDTPIAQGGFNLSGGQRQRLCLARGILAARNSSILLLDEPTSALDPLTEALVHDRLHEAFPQACLIASVHRMSLLDRFDRIVLMVNGTILDSGRYDEVYARQAVFRDMVGGAALADVKEAAPLEAC
ncbi:MAG: ABC transporter ATP-binding protein [Pseudomonadota bacterium]